MPFERRILDLDNVRVGLGEAMVRRARRLVALPPAILALALGVSAADANTSIDFGLFGFEATSSSITFEAGALELIVEMTLEATIARSVRKVRGEALGALNRVTIAGCVTSAPAISRCRIVALPPIEVVYESFSGSLPANIEPLVTLRELGFNVTVTGLGGGLIWDCLYQGDQGIQIESAGRTARPLNTTLRRVRRAAGECPAETALRGSFTFVNALRMLLLNR